MPPFGGSPEEKGLREEKWLRNAQPVFFQVLTHLLTFSHNIFSEGEPFLTTPPKGVSSMAYILFNAPANARKGRSVKVTREDGSIKSVLVQRTFTRAGVRFAIVDGPVAPFFRASERGQRPSRRKAAN